MFRLCRAVCMKCSISKQHSDLLKNYHISDMMQYNGSRMCHLAHFGIECLVLEVWCNTHTGPGPGESRSGPGET